MDMVASGLEANPWGYSGYGFEPYVRASPENLVAALLHYWLDTVRPALAFEASNPEICFRLYYEALVTEPEVTLQALCEYLELPWASEMLDPNSVFSSGSSSEIGPGDHKVQFTSQIETESVGRGVEIPVRLVPELLRQALNDTLKELEYPTVGSDWNMQPALLRVTSASRRQHMTTSLEKIFAGVVDKLQTLGLPGNPKPIRVIIDTVPRLEWLIDFSTRQAIFGAEVQERETAIVVAPEAFINLASGGVAAGSLLRDNVLRFASETSQREEVEVVKLLVSCLLDSETI